MTSLKQPTFLKLSEAEAHDFKILLHRYLVYSAGERAMLEDQMDLLDTTNPLRSLNRNLISRLRLTSDLADNLLQRLYNKDYEKKADHEQYSDPKYKGGL